MKKRSSAGTFSILSDRRAVLRAGSVFGLGLMDWFRLSDRIAAQDTPAVAKSCVLVWLDGGPSHLETLDPKSDAPREVRGPLDSIATFGNPANMLDWTRQTFRVELR